MSTKHLLKKFTGPLGIFFLSLLVTFVWFRKGLMFGGGEEGLPFYDLDKYSASVANIWHDYNAGFSVVHLLPRIPFFWFLKIINDFGLDLVVLQFLTFLILIFTGCTSVYLVVKELIVNKFKDDPIKLVPLLSSVFYLLNPYSMSQVWGRGIYGQFFGFALMPLFLYSFIKGLKSRNVNYFILGIFSTLFFSVSFTVITQIFVLWFPIFLYLFFYVTRNLKNKSTVLFSLASTFALLFFWILTNFWWIYPTFRVGNNAYSVFLGDSGNIDTLKAISNAYAKPEYVIRLLQGFYFFISDTYGGLYISSLFQFLSWIPPILSVLSLKFIKLNKEYMFFLVLFIITFFFVLGSNPPLGSFFVWLFTNIPYFQAFRNPYEKAGLLLSFAYSPLFALGVVFMSQRFSSFIKTTNKKLLTNILSLILVILVCVVLVWPLWIGSFNKGWTKIPKDYKELNEWLLARNDDSRIIQMPLITGDGVRYNWQFPYQGIEPSEILFVKPSIGSNNVINKIYYNVLLQRFGNLSLGSFGIDPDISRSEFRSDDLWEELAKLNVRYIVFHNDIEDWVIGQKTKEDFRNYISKQRNIRKIKIFGELDVYEVVYPKEIGLIHSPQVKTNYLKISPSHYKVFIEKSQISEFDLHFLSMFHSSWEAYIGDKKIETHTEVFSYANKWEINRKPPFEIDIVFTPQKYVAEGTKISWVSTIVLIIFLFIQIYNSNKWKQKRI